MTDNIKQSMIWATSIFLIISTLAWSHAIKKIYSRPLNIYDLVQECRWDGRKSEFCRILATKIITINKE